MNNHLRNAYILAVFFQLSIVSGAATAQVNINPTMLILSDDDTIRNVTLTNTTATSLEVSLDLAFGYPVTDDTGNLSMEYFDTARAGQFGLDEYVRIFPRRFVLQPGERQIVRIQVALPQNSTEHQMYWSRLRISSNELEVDADLDGEMLVTRIRYRIQQNIGLFYKNGEMQSGVRRSAPVQLIRNEQDIPQVLIPFEQVGNAPFMGQYTYWLINAEGAEVIRARRTFSVYFNRILALDLGDGSLPPGLYTLHIQTGNDRQDIPAPDRVPVGQNYTEVFSIQI